MKQFIVTTIEGETRDSMGNVHINEQVLKHFVLADSAKDAIEQVWSLKNDVAEVVYKACLWSKEKMRAYELKG